MPQQPPKGLELNYLIDDDCSDFWWVSRQLQGNRNVPSERL
jgi:hypothetical protein